MAASTSKIDGLQLQIRFITKQQQYSVPDTSFVVPSNTGIYELNTLLNELLKESSTDDWKEIEFDFLALGELIRSQLSEHISDRGLSAESVITVEYFEKLPSPEPEDCLLHDDWVSAVHLKGKWIISGCYDSTLHLWTTKGKHKLTIPGHTGAIKGVAWVSQNDSIASFVSVSHDQSAMLWEWNVSNNSVECIHMCKGHERSVECVSVDPTSQKFATGSWDSLLKIWSASLHRGADSDFETSSSKRARRDNKSQIRTPLLTLKGHKEAISGVCWLTDGQIVTSSWDHTLKVWDVEYGAIKCEIPGNKSYFDVHVSPVSGNLITASADRHIRLYDPRSTEGSVVKATFTSHMEWVQTVRWSTTEENLFVSGAYDSHFKLWDIRNTRVPLFDLMGHEDKILCSDWSDPKYLLSGGADNTLRIFKSNKYDVKNINEDYM
ncbi:ribosome biogenesis protein WDR12 homolog [Lycorma delicatula]|uniref:ribosome biogenesis protein WDR12 homolog n=1 Tax=Lycorma delicatula TaxID=130591 RepID=UPI003F50FBB2